MKSTATAVLAPIALACSLAACSSVDLEALRRSPENQIALIDATYATVKLLIPPPCSPAVQVLCLDEGSAGRVAHALALADIAVATAKQIILTANSDAGAISRGVSIALNAVAALRLALTTVGVPSG